MIRTLTTAAALVTTSIVAIVAPTVTQQAQALDDTPWTLPVTPPRCTVQQAESGDVGGCLLAFYDDPTTTGWGAPPAPGVGDGWIWNGYRYNGSPALAGWEATYIAANASPVAGLRAGTLLTHVAAQELFEGFLAEIAANGYRVRDAGGYSFRCTSGNGGWSCPSGDPGDLSNHAWGLAIDMNAGTNPIRSYSGVDGQTACLTPIQTDLPRWVIQTAERWGLYWGGYGWNSGCQSTETQRTTVYRDPPHFEFRGTPRQARAIADFNLRNDPAATCFDVVTEAGAAAERCTRAGKPQADWRLPVDLDPPTGAVAAMINLTVTEPDWHGFLTLESCGSRSGDRTTSAITFAPDETRAAMAIVPLDDDGRICVYRSTGAHSIVDVVAYLGGDGEPLWFEPTDPTRLTDSREVGACAPQQDCRPGPVPDQSRQFIPTADDAPRIANVTVVDGAGPGFLQAGRCDIVGERPFSNLNYASPTARANLALIDDGGAGSCVFALRQAHVIVDELGRLDPDAGYGWRLGAPRRAIDTRECTPAWCAGTPAAMSAVRVDLGTDAPAAAIALTVTQPQGPGFLWAGPCALLDGTAGPTTSNLNHVAGQTVTNLALVAVDDGEICVWTLAGAHVIVDVQAELVTDHALGVLPIDPTRFHDSRG